MPIVKIEMLAGRQGEKKHELAREITAAFSRVLGSAPKDVTITFTDVAPSDWVIAGEPLSASVTAPSPQR
ncbi:tautomerase family protein [Pseudomonas moraviensis]|uniref:2-hydroxymuconate tautomerase n=1 Tax=Pseudomonas moraviensis TaxID=321662 RepID=A0A7Y9W1F4_9PSED|nr:4-oxalocrotonate tautomerase family protein [Pseudomonas moraviensis]NYH11908.1 4-oxalocrotonate tautomerase [Pseudomonas moraviensis]